MIEFRVKIAVVGDRVAGIGGSLHKDSSSSVEFCLPGSESRLVVLEAPRHVEDGLDIQGIDLMPFTL